MSTSRPFAPTAPTAKEATQGQPPHHLRQETHVVPGSAEHVYLHLCNGRGLACPHFPKYSTEASTKHRRYPSRLGFFQATSSEGHISFLDTCKFCSECLDRVVPDGYTYWSAAQRLSRDPCISSDRWLAAPSSTQAYPRLFLSGTEKFEHLSFRPSTVPEHLTTSPTTIPIPQVTGAHDAWLWIQSQRKPFYVDGLHLVKGWTPFSQLSAQNDAQIASISGEPFKAQSMHATPGTPLARPYNRSNVGPEATRARQSSSSTLDTTARIKEATPPQRAATEPLAYVTGQSATPSIKRRPLPTTRSIAEQQPTPASENTGAYPEVARAIATGPKQESSTTITASLGSRSDGLDSRLERTGGVVRGTQSSSKSHSSSPSTAPVTRNSNVEAAQAVDRSTSSHPKDSNKIKETKPCLQSTYTPPSSHTTATPSQIPKKAETTTPRIASPRSSKRKDVNQVVPAGSEIPSIARPGIIARSTAEAAHNTEGSKEHSLPQGDLGIQYKSNLSVGLIQSSDNGSQPRSGKEASRSAPPRLPIKNWYQYAPIPLDNPHVPLSTGKTRSRKTALLAQPSVTGLSFEKLLGQVYSSREELTREKSSAFDDSDVLSLLASLSGDRIRTPRVSKTLKSSMQLFEEPGRQSGTLVSDVPSKKQSGNPSRSHLGTSAPQVRREKQSEKALPIQLSESSSPNRPNKQRAEKPPKPEKLIRPPASHESDSKLSTAKQFSTHSITKEVLIKNDPSTPGIKRHAPASIVKGKEVTSSQKEEPTKSAGAPILSQSSLSSARSKPAGATKGTKPSVNKPVHTSNGWTKEPKAKAGPTRGVDSQAKKTASTSTETRKKKPTQPGGSKPDKDKRDSNLKHGKPAAHQPRISNKHKSASNSTSQFTKVNMYSMPSDSHPESDSPTHESAPGSPAFSTSTSSSIIASESDPGVLHHVEPSPLEPSVDGMTTSFHGPIFGASPEQDHPHDPWLSPSPEPLEPIQLDGNGEQPPNLFNRPIDPLRPQDLSLDLPLQQGQLYNQGVGLSSESAEPNWPDAERTSDSFTRPTDLPGSVKSSVEHPTVKDQLQQGRQSPFRETSERFQLGGRQLPDSFNGTTESPTPFQPPTESQPQRDQPHGAWLSPSSEPSGPVQPWPPHVSGASWPTGSAQEYYRSFSPVATTPLNEHMTRDYTGLQPPPLAQDEMGNEPRAALPVENSVRSVGQSDNFLQNSIDAGRSQRNLSGWESQVQPLGFNGQHKQIKPLAETPFQDPQNPGWNTWNQNTTPAYGHQSSPLSWSASSRGRPVAQETQQEVHDAYTGGDNCSSAQRKPTAGKTTGSGHTPIKVGAVVAAAGLAAGAFWMASSQSKENSPVQSTYSSGPHDEDPWEVPNQRVPFAQYGNESNYFDQKDDEASLDAPVTAHDYNSFDHGEMTINENVQNQWEIGTKSNSSSGSSSGHTDGDLPYYAAYGEPNDDTFNLGPVEDDKSDPESDASLAEYNGGPSEEESSTGQDQTGEYGYDLRASDQSDNYQSDNYQSDNYQSANYQSDNQHCTDSDDERIQHDSEGFMLDENYGYSEDPHSYGQEQSDDELNENQQSVAPSEDQSDKYNHGPYGNENDQDDESVPDDESAQDDDDERVQNDDSAQDDDSAQNNEGLSEGFDGSFDGDAESCEGEYSDGYD